MKRLFILIVISISAVTMAPMAQEKRFTLKAAPELVESGALKFILPRFSLKTGIRVDIVQTGGTVTLDASETGVPVFRDLANGTVYRLILGDDVDPFAARFRDWLTSAAGLRAVEGFKADAAQALAAVETKVVEETVSVPTGDAALGETLAMQMCGRCHVVSDRNRFGGIGSTPSFGAMKNFPDWRQRFEAFWTLNPHPAFTQIEGVTEPFDHARPSPIVPLELTMDQVEAIIAFVVALPRKDLGAALLEQ